MSSSSTDSSVLRLAAAGALDGAFAWTPGPGGTGGTLHFAGALAGLAGGAETPERWGARAHPEDQAELRRAFTALGDGGSTPPFAVRLRVAEGVWRRVEVRAVVATRAPDDAPTLIVGALRDLCSAGADDRYARLAEEHEALEQRFAARTAELKAANEELQRAGSAKDEFLASMSHELRTPLNAILGNVELLQDDLHGPLADEQRRALAVVEQSGRHLLSLINDVLDLSKVQSGVAEVRLGPVDVDDVVDQSLRLVREQAQRKRIVMSTSRDGRVTVIRGEERRLKQILVNLLANAIKFTPEEGRVGLEVEADPEGSRVRFVVWDEGQGIAPEDVARLFRPFSQLDRGLARRYEGTGLGLYLVARMAELHGGAVAVESRGLGHGSRFTVTLPWIAEGPLDGLPDPALTPAPPQGLAPLPPAAQVARQAEALGARVTVAPCWSIERVVELRPDVVVLDLASPEVGWAAVQALRLDPRTAELPAIVLGNDERDRALAAAAALPVLLGPVEGGDLRVALGPGARPGRILVFGSLERRLTPRVLIAEDNENNLKMMTDYLQALGWTVTAARDGAELIACAGEAPPDAIVVDVQMPILDGLEATRRIRKEPRLVRVPIVAVTALAMPGDRERCLEAGADEYLTKPVRLRTLARVLEARVARGRRSTGRVLRPQRPSTS